jgi:hypothetical protein
MSDGGHQLTKEEEDYFRRRFEPLKIFSERTPAPDPSHGAIFNAHVTARQGSVSLNSSYGGAPRPPALGGYSTSVYGSTPLPAKNASSNEPWLSQYAQPVELTEITGSRGPPHQQPPPQHPGTTSYPDSVQEPPTPFGSQGAKSHPSMQSHPTASSGQLRLQTSCDRCRRIKRGCDRQRPCKSCSEIPNVVCLYSVRPSACDNCRNSKLKCDHNVPCGSCRTRSKECTYTWWHGRRGGSGS